MAWPTELQQRKAAAMAAWAEIERLRARSDEIEAMDPMPVNIGDGGLWAAIFELVVVPDVAPTSPRSRSTAPAVS